MKLLTANKKLEKSTPGYRILGLALAPYNFSGVTNVCPWAGECAKKCIWTSGLNAIPAAKNSKIAKTQYFAANRALFISQLDAEITVEKIRAQRDGLKLAVRLNLYSDIVWDAIARELFERHLDVIFYDYTKRPSKLGMNLPENYSLTYSLNEKTTEQEFQSWMAIANVAAVFAVKRGEALPSHFKGYPVIDGDIHDARFLDKQGVIVGLRAKNGLKDSAFIAA